MWLQAHYCSHVTKMGSFAFYVLHKKLFRLNTSKQLYPSNVCTLYCLKQAKDKKQRKKNSPLPMCAKICIMYVGIAHKIAFLRHVMKAIPVLISSPTPTLFDRSRSVGRSLSFLQRSLSLFLSFSTSSLKTIDNEPNF